MSIRRCWRHVVGFPDINYVEWDGSRMWLVRRSGQREVTQEYTIEDCEGFVARGTWYEWDGNDPTNDGDE